MAFVNNTTVRIQQLLNLSKTLSTRATSIRKITGISDITHFIKKCHRNLALRVGVRAENINVVSIDISHGEYPPADLFIKTVYSKQR